MASDYKVLSLAVSTNINVGMKFKNLHSTVEPGNSKLFEKQQKVYYCQKFTIERF